MALTNKQVSEIRLRLNGGEKGCDLAKEFGVSNSYVSQIKSRKRGARQVWLTVEEAMELQLILNDLVDLHDKNYLKLSSFAFDVIDTIDERIKKAEKIK